MCKKVFIWTAGCQMNVRDSEVISGLLKESGYRISENDTEADVIIFNTCSVRKHAEDRVWSLIGSYKGSKIIGLVGCMAQNYKEKAFERDANVSFVVGPQDIDKIPEVLGKILETRGQSPKHGDSPLLLERKIWEVDNRVRPEEIYHTGFYQDKNHAYVVISEGCSNFCSYCVVPYVRGPLRHRKSKDILAEIQEGIAWGITSVTLLGQNVNAYSDGKVDFNKLLEQVSGLDGLKEFDFFTSHPKDANLDSFKAIRDLDKLAKRLHLPLQSGSDRILKLMNRGYLAKEYLDLIDSYRKIVKGGLLTTDIIVGFPTETEKEFKETYNLVKKVGFNSAYLFKYSSRPGTRAEKIGEDLSREEKEKRHQQILDLQRGISKKLRQKHAHEKIGGDKLFFLLLIFFIIPAIAQGADLDSLKADFLQGNYRRVIFEAQPLVDRAGAGRAEELNYILGLSYLKEGKLEQAQDCFKRILAASSNKFKAQASLGLADAYLMAGRFQEAQDIYAKLIADNSNSSQKAAILYRLSQLEFKKGNTQQGNDYLFKLRRDFPLSPELRLDKGLSLITLPVSSVRGTGEYSVQVGFFSNSSNANILKNKLLAENYPAYLDDSGAGFRVRVGRFKSQKEALDLESKLSKEGYQTKICSQ